MWSEEGDEWKRPAKYRAPSWSWASVDGSVELNLKAYLKIPGQEAYGGPEMAQKFRFQDAKVDIDSLDPFGEFSGGNLKLFDRLRQIAIRDPDWTTDALSDDDGPLRYERQEYWEMLPGHVTRKIVEFGHHLVADRG